MANVMAQAFEELGYEAELVLLSQQQDMKLFVLVNYTLLMKLGS